jgi:hypothetical protein
MTDMFFIGQTGDPNMAAAVSLAFPLFMLSQALGSIFATGGSSYISRMLGARQTGEARHTSAVSFYGSIAVCCALAHNRIKIHGSEFLYRSNCIRSPENREFLHEYAKIPQVQQAHRRRTSFGPHTVYF